MDCNRGGYISGDSVYEERTDNGLGPIHGELMADMEAGEEIREVLDGVPERASAGFYAETDATEARLLFVSLRQSRATRWRLSFAAQLDC